MASLDWSQCPAVESIPGKVSGAWVFKGTRTPVATVFENLLESKRLDERIRSSGWAHSRSQWSDRPPSTLGTSKLFGTIRFSTLSYLSP
jgi:hypothetical protein